MSIKDSYLIVYNAICCVGWATVLALATKTLVNGILDGNDGIGAILSSVYGTENLAFLLNFFQSLAVLEVVHAALGLVRSPVLITAVQVGSRLAAIFASSTSPASQVQFGAGLMIISWALVEVPRYAFYMAAIITGDATKKTPFPLFWLRYSLFAVLYPTGITGEITVFLAASKDEVFLNQFGEAFATFLYFFILSFPVIYVPGSPVMILNMAGNRKNAFKKRFAKPPPPPRGLVFPVSGTEGGKEVRSSTPVGKEIIAAAIGAVSAEKAQKVLKEKNWRFGYNKHFRVMVEEQCKSPEAALAVAKAGLAKAYDTFQFISPDGKTTRTLGKVMAEDTKETFCTGFVKGEASSTTKGMEVPYKGKTLKGEELKAQVKKWVDYGTIEPSAGEAICKCVDNPSWLSLKDRYFVLLGAGSAMGPFLVLMALGANVVAIDLDRPRIWERLIGIAKKSSGSLTFPMSKEQKACENDAELYASSGCNLFTQTPQIRNWLLTLYPGKPFTVGNYAYLDGALHVQVSIAMDAIGRDLSEKRKGTSLAYLCTPTDLHLIPKEAYDASNENYADYSRRLFCILMNVLSGGSFLRKNMTKPVEGQGGDYYVVNGLVVAQGPNYALAKRMQHWRAIVARAHGCVVSSNIAPSTSTASVVHNRTFAWAYEGMPYFKPFEVSTPETSNAVMSAILLYDLHDSGSVGNPSVKLNNPNQLFQSGSFHGGAWRSAFEFDSIGESSVIIYFSRAAAPYLSALTAAGVAAAAAYFYYL